MFDILLVCPISLSQELQISSADPVQLLSPPVPHGLSGPSAHSFTRWQMDVSKSRRALSGERLGQLWSQHGLTERCFKRNDEFSMSNVCPVSS